MKYMTIVDGYIRSVSQISGNVHVTEEEYRNLISMIASKPPDPDGYQYRLRADNLEWELVELPPIEPEPLTDEAAITRYANELTGQNDPDLISAAETMITKLSKEE